MPTSSDPTKQDSIPTGIVTFLFTDVEGSTRLWAADAVQTAASFVVHNEIIRDAIERRGGFVFGIAGDSFRGAFSDPNAAVAAAIDATERLAAVDWNGPGLLVRMGLHRGRATVSDRDYLGPVPNTCARIEGVAHGGQILVSEAVRSALDVETVYLGDHRLRDVPEPMALHQIGTTRHRPLQSINPDLSTLPHVATDIVGRAAEIREIRHLLETSSLVTLTGVGGSGKTRLAVEVAHQELPSRPDGCYFADLTGVSEAGELPAALASAIRLKVTSDDPLGQVAAHLASREALLVLDNCEHILDECAEFAEQLLARSGSTILMATTRQRLDVPGEQVVVVSSLDHSSQTAAAVELFVQRATAAAPGFEIDDSNRSIVAEICARLDGLPLAIELAAARAAVLSPEALLARMEDRFRLLSGGRGRHRRRTLQATLDWSFDLLEPDEQDFFSRCGVFIGSFDLAAATAVARPGDEFRAVDLLVSLLSKSLLVADDVGSIDAKRFRLLETVRIYAGDQLARIGGIAESRDRHLAHYRSIVHTDSVDVADDIDRGRSLRPDWPNIASALEWASSNDRWSEAADLAFGCQGLWEHQLPATEGRRWLELIIPNLDPADQQTHWLCFHRALLAMQLDDFEAVHRDLGALTESPHPAVCVQALALHGFTRLRQTPEESRRLFASAEQLIQKANLGPESRCPLNWGRATDDLYAARFEDARIKLETAFDDASSGDYQRTHLIIAGLSLASAEVLAGLPDQALLTLVRVDWSRSVWDSSQVVRGVALVDSGRPDLAAVEIIAFARKALLGRLNRMSNDALVGLAALAINRNEPDRARALLLQAATPRTPFTIALAEGLADRIGFGDELRHRHRDRATPLALLDGTAALRGELTRLGISGNVPNEQ